VELVGGGVWRLAEERSERFTMIVFYRGRHCHVCSHYLAELESILDEFSRRGVSVVAISCDTEERAASAKQDWKLDRLRIERALRPSEQSTRLETARQLAVIDRGGAMGQ
jgi:alkyl hydroperoxide reductase subunit AhpC